jgi:hypothetical protein
MMPKTRQRPTREARTAGAARKPIRPAQPAKPNPFDAIARQVNADQEARDRVAGRDDLTSRSSPVRPAAGPPRTAAPRAGATSTHVVFHGRPTTRAETVAARARQLRLRVRANPDVEALAGRLRATPAAVQAWLDTRNGRPPAAAGPAAAPLVAVPRPWKGRIPREMPELKGATLVTSYEVRPDGTVWRTLSEVLGPDGRPLEDFWRLPLDFRPRPETLGNRRKVTLQDRSRHGLEAWLAKAGRDAPA